LTENNKVIVSIGMPVFNGEKFLKKAIDSILSQTFKNFELIISDNASTDSTPKICKEYTLKDNRIRYFRQPENLGPLKNFWFVLEEAKCEYFMWAAADDIRYPLFLEKTFNMLSLNKNAVCCMSNAKFYSLENDVNSNDNRISNLMLKLRYTLKPAGIYSITGSYKKKIRKYLKKSRAWAVYGLYKTDILQKSFLKEYFYGNMTACMLNALRKGDMIIVNETLTEFYSGGISKQGIFKAAKSQNKGIVSILFPFYPLTSWCWNNLGSKIFLMNLDYFIELNLWGVFSQIVDIFRIIINKFLK
jgi:glycosyltransferase involved in cell wall biosynthesis